MLKLSSKKIIFAEDNYFYIESKQFIKLKYETFLIPNFTN
jgi:hypothetical protein